MIADKSAADEDMVLCYASFYSTFLFTSRDLDSCLSQTSVMTFLTTTLIPFIILSYALIKIRQKMHIILLHKEYNVPFTYSMLFAIKPF